MQDFLWNLLEFLLATYLPFLTLFDQPAPNATLKVIPTMKIASMKINILVLLFMTVTRLSFQLYHMILIINNYCQLLCKFQISYESFSHKDILYLNRHVFYFIFKKLIISGVVYPHDWNNILYTIYYGITII